MAGPQVKKSERGVAIVIVDVLFGTGQACLTRDGMNTVRKLADVIKNSNRIALVEGFTDWFRTARDCPSGVPRRDCQGYRVAGNGSADRRPIAMWKSSVEGGAVLLHCLSHL